MKPIPNSLDWPDKYQILKNNNNPCVSTLMGQDCADTWLIVLICEARITWFPVAELMTVIRFYAGWVN
jgi:hypothetical protein